MGVIYCNSCDLGIHYIDACRGGKNGVPRMSEKKDKFYTALETALWTFMAIAVVSAFVMMAYMLIKITI
jgi:hypothetical protein